MIKRSLVWLSPTTVSVTVLAGCSVAEQCNFILVKGRWMLWRQEGSRESDVALVMRHRLCVLCGHQPMASETWRWAPYLWYTCSRNNLDHGVVNLSLSYCVTPSSLQLAFVELVTEKRPLFVTAAFPAYFFCVPTQIRGYIFSFFFVRSRTLLQCTWVNSLCFCSSDKMPFAHMWSPIHFRNMCIAVHLLADTSFSSYITSAFSCVAWWHSGEGVGLAIGAHGFNSSRCCTFECDFG